MVRKMIGYYTETGQAPITDADQLIIEIGSTQVVCLVKGAVSKEIEGFEMFELEKDKSDWNDIFYELRTASQLLNIGYRNTHCYYNFEEAIIIPEKRFSPGAAEDYLNLIYGESDRHDIKFDTIHVPTRMVNAYRVRKSIHELVGRHFLLYKPHHSYSSIIQDILSRYGLADHFMKVQFYATHMIVAVVVDKQLQLIQSFQFDTTDDVLYHLTNITQQFALDAAHSHAEISGK
ncbi:MAG: DUF3822 family protein, partial [Sediminibacterium sp.]